MTPATRSPRNRRRVAGLVVAGIAALFFGIACFFAVNNLLFQFGSSTAVGEVVGVETMRDPSGQMRVPVTYQAVIEFPDRNGQFRRFTDVSSSRNPPSIGGDVKVLYLTKRPSEAKVANYLALWREAINAGVAALVAGIVAEELLRGNRAP